MLGGVSPKGLPRPIPVDELQVMIGSNQAFCSWEASILKASEEMARWPFLFSGQQEPAADKAKTALFEKRKGCGTPLRD